MSMFKKTEHNPICKVFTKVYAIGRIPHSTVLITEADVQKYSAKKVFLKISQNSQEKTCLRASFFISFLS